MAESPDRWHRWLLHTRHGGDPEAREQELAGLLYPIRDKVLSRARLGDSDTLLDVGAGDGLIAFGALERLGPSGHVIFSDISQDLLEHCRKAEPIGVLMRSRDPGRFSGYDVRPVAPLAAKVKALYESIQPPGEDPMVDFDERDLVRLAEDAQFSEVDLELHVTVKDTRPPVPWDRYLRMSANPLAPPLGEALGRTLSPGEIGAFTAHLRPLVESGTGVERRAFAYLAATKS